MHDPVFFDFEHHNVNHVGVGVQQIVIQIKVAHPYGACDDCCNFLSNIASVTANNYQQPSAFRAHHPITRDTNAPPVTIDFGGNNIFNVTQNIRNKSGGFIGAAVGGIGVGTQIRVRISNDNHNVLMLFNY
ncbi:MAG: hypothetical protein LBF54_00760 [Holosporaceae bacterium]|nr:hypothetical protein [Holosporaceae bacterium]